MFEEVLVPDLNRLESDRLRSLGFSISNSCAESSVEDTGEVMLPKRKQIQTAIGVCV